VRNTKLQHTGRISRRSALLGLAGTTFASTTLAQNAGVRTGTQTTPLALWNDGPAKQAVLEFVRATTDQSSKDFVSPDDRIATFDQDGTLWVEHPLYSQALFALDRVRELAPKHPEWKDQEPFKTVLSGDMAAVAHLTEGDHLRYPFRHEPVGFPGDRRAVAGNCEAPAISTALYRPRLSTDD
jgi:hypothetical protein